MASACISDERVTIITNNPSQRYFYSMVFDNKYRVKIASRNVNIPGVQNFRDLGGYKSSETGQNTRWGMLYRSANIEPKGSTERKLKSIGVKTLIDLRPQRERKSVGDSLAGARVVRIPIDVMSLTSLLGDIQQGKADSKKIDELTKQFYRDFVANYHDEYRQMFDVLLDKSNYPVVIYCSSGKGRTGIAAALVLAALGVDENTIVQDYRLSNDYYNIAKAYKYAYNLPPASQEAVTSLYTAKEKFINAASAEIKKISGDKVTFLKEQIGLSEDEIEKLRSILLE